MNSLLRNVRQLAVHAANTGVNDQVAVQADQTQISSAIASIQRIAEQTQFGTKHLLDGSSGIAANVVDTKNIAGISIGGVFNNLTTQSGTVNVVVNSVATRAQVSGTALATYASVNASISTVNGLKTGSGGTVVLNGQTISVSGSDTVQTLINKINNLAGTTGVSADFTSGNGSGAIVLTQQNYGSNFAINESESLHPADRHGFAHAGQGEQCHCHRYRFGSGQWRRHQRRRHLHRGTFRHRQRAARDR